MRDRILTAARAVVAERGAAVTLADIARRAETTTVTIHRHFGDRAGLLAAIGQESDAPGTRDRIIAAAARLFAANGVAGTTMERIAEDAGVSPPTLYWHFRGKDDITRALIGTFEAKIEGVIGRMASAPGAPGAWFGTFFRNAIATQLENVDLVRVMMTEVATKPDLADLVCRKIVLPNWSTLARAIDSQVAEGRFRPGPAMARVVALLGMVTYYSLVRRIFGDRIDLPPPNEVADEFQRMFLEGVTDGDRNR